MYAKVYVMLLLRRLCPDTEERVHSAQDTRVGLGGSQLKSYKSLA